MVKRCLTHPASTYRTKEDAAGNLVTHCKVCGVFLGTIPAKYVPEIRAAAARAQARQDNNRLVVETPEPNFMFPEEQGK